MPVDIKVPSVGESITEGTLSRWLKSEGEAVQEGEALFELETEKATTEVPAPTAGTVHITVHEGQTVKVGGVVGKIDPAGAPASPPKSASIGRPPAPNADKAPAVTPAKTTAEAGSNDHPGSVAMPAARRLASESAVAVQEVPGTGRGGRILKEDVQNFIELRKTPPPETAPPKPGATSPPPIRGERGERRQRMTSIRARIADRLVQSQQTTATLTTFNEADLSAVLALRARYEDRFKEKYGVGLGFMGFFVKAAVEALRAHPLVNSRIDGGDVVTPDYQDIGVAVSTERGLMVPVLRDAGRRSFAAIEKDIAALAEKARAGKIDVSDLQGGTFTITNGGVFGSLLSTPILNPPQSAILGMHTIQKRPIAVDDQVVIRPMMYLALSYDHRIIDGREAVLFLVRVKDCIEDPQRLLLEV